MVLPDSETKSLKEDKNTGIRGDSDTRRILANGMAVNIALFAKAYSDIPNLEQKLLAYLKYESKSSMHVAANCIGDWDVYTSSVMQTHSTHKSFNSFNNPGLAQYSINPKVNQGTRESVKRVCISIYITVYRF